MANNDIVLRVGGDESTTLSVGTTTLVSTSDYEELRNLPSIEGVELIGNKTLDELNAYTQDQVDAKLADKANKSDIPSLTGYATETWVKGQNYASANDIYTKGQTDTLLASKANKSDIPSLTGYATEQWVENKHYLTQHQSLADYYKKEQTDALLNSKADASAIPTKTSQLTNDSGFVTDAGVTSFNGQKGAVTYTAPVTSVNGKTGAVTVDVPTKTSDLTNDSGFITSAPVTSVNGETGAVTINVPSNVSELINDMGFIESGVIDEYLGPKFYATDATSQAALSQAAGGTPEIVTPMSLIQDGAWAIFYGMNPRYMYGWMNGTELELARLGASLNTQNSTLTLYLRGRTSIATGKIYMMDVETSDTSWTVTPLASDAEGVAY